MSVASKLSTLENALGQVSIINSTPSVSSTTGALTVTGGVGIQGSVNVGANLTAVGNMTVNGAITATNFFLGSFALVTATNVNVQFNAASLGTINTLNFTTGTTATLSGGVLNVTTVDLNFGTNLQNAVSGQTVVYSTSTSNWNKRSRITKSASAPSSPLEGDLWLDTNLGGWYMWLTEGGGVVGNAWVEITR